jgi:hypothetical protein
MIQRDFIHLKIISVSLMIFFQSCSTQKNTNVTTTVVKDYISEYSKTIGEKPRAILIRKDEKSVITIKDLPEETSLGYLQKSLQKKENISTGKFFNVLCVYYVNEISKDEINFKEVSLKLKKKAEQTDKIVIGGKEILISNDIFEWQPQLVIKYNLLSKSKVVNNYKEKAEKSIQ